jgi:hypothetical protein
VNTEILGKLPVEERGTFVNLEGRVQNTHDTITPPQGALSFCEDFLPLLVMSVVSETKNSFNLKDLSNKTSLDSSLLNGSTLRISTGFQDQSDSFLGTQTGLFNSTCPSY